MQRSILLVLCGMALGAAATPLALLTTSVHGNPKTTNVTPTSGLAVSVKDYGAVGNGTTDDTAAINAAIDALPTPGGGTVFFPPGSYKVTSTIDWDSKPIHLLGSASGVQPAAGTRIVAAAGVTAFNPQTGTAGMGAFSVIENFHIIGADTALGPNNGVKLQANNSTLRNVCVEGFGGHGIHVLSTATVEFNANNCLIERSRSYRNHGDGFHIEGGNSNVITLLSCDASQNGGWGFHETGTINNTYIGCHAAANANYKHAGVTFEADKGDMLLGAGARSATVIAFYSETIGSGASYVGFKVDSDNGGHNHAQLMTMGNVVTDATSAKTSSIMWPQGNLHYNRLLVGDGTNTDVTMHGGQTVAIMVGRGRTFRLQSSTADVNWDITALADKRLQIGSAQGQPVKFDNPVQLPSYTIDGRPNPIEFRGALIFVTDGAPGSKLQYSDGTTWVSAG